MSRWKRWISIGAGFFLALILVGPFLVPIRPLEDTVPPQSLAGPDSQFLEVNGLQVHYRAAGSGQPAFVLLHGFLASTYSWREVIDPLSAYGRVVAFDRPAFGLTERPMPREFSSGNPYSPDAQVQLTIGLMDRLGIDRAILVGNSAGGSIAALTALRHPDRVQALVLVDAAIFTSAGTPAWLKPILRTPQLRRLGPVLIRSVESWGEDFGRSAWHDPEAISPEVWEGYLRPLRAEHWDRALYEFALASRRLDLPQRLDELVLPTLVVTGDDDRIVPAQESVQLANELPNAALVVLPECGHVPQEECPGPFLDATLRFLASEGILPQ